jgi:hypothetical protein
MARRVRRPPAPEPPDQTPGADDLALEDFVDARYMLVFDDEPARLHGNEAARVHWWRDHHPQAVRGADDARRHAERRLLRDAWNRLTAAEKRTAIRAHRARAGAPLATAPPIDCWPRDPRTES